MTTTNEQWEKEFENYPLFQLPALVVKVIGYDKNGNAYKGRAFNILSLLSHQKEAWAGEMREALLKHRKDDTYIGDESAVFRTTMDEVLALLQEIDSNK